jgi:hypothetical protein
MADDLDHGFEPLDLSSFRVTGPNFALDAYHFSRAVLAVLATTDTDAPKLQIEIFDSLGALLIGTDGYSLLGAWVPWPDVDGWDATRRYGAERPAGNVEPSLVLVASDTEGDLPRWAAKYAKASRAKGRPKEQVTVEVGTLTTPEPVLSDEVAPWGIRFGGDSNQIVLPYTMGAGINWRPWAEEVEHGKPADGAIKLGATRFVQLGRLAGISVERTIHLQARDLDDGRGSVVTVDVPGFPHVAGYIAAAR